MSIVATPRHTGVISIIVEVGFGGDEGCWVVVNFELANSRVGCWRFKG
jgi:hypothetical protein